MSPQQLRDRPARLALLQMATIWASVNRLSFMPTLLAVPPHCARKASYHASTFSGRLPARRECARKSSLLSRLLPLHNRSIFWARTPDATRLVRSESLKSGSHVDATKRPAMMRSSRPLFVDNAKIAMSLGPSIGYHGVNLVPFERTFLLQEPS
jgi:hypothetical protein